MDVTDDQLLADFTRNKSDDAFRQLVSRYVNLVHAAATRQVRDCHLADEVTQATFIVLARRASSVSPRHLPGWLLLTARFCARDALKKQARRSRHEHEAAAMRSNISETIEPMETDIGPFLDEAMARLCGRERTAVAMRFLQDKPIIDVAVALGTSPNAVQKIIARSLPKLRKMLVRKGIALPSVAVLSTALLRESAHAAPVNFSVPLTQSSPESLSIAKGAMNIMKWAKIKFAAAIAAAVLVTSGTGFVVLNRSIAASTDGPIPTQSHQPAVAPRDKNLVGFASPFLELVGCRIKQPINFTLTRKPSAEQQVSWMEQQYPLIRWSIDPNLAKDVSGYTVSIAPVDDPTSAKSVAVAKNAAELDPGPLEPGDYIIKVSANGPGPTALAESTAHVTVEPLPMTQIMISDLQPDGAIKFTGVMQYMNAGFNEIREGNFMNSTFVNVNKMTDDQGNPLPFTVARRDDILGDIFQYHYNLNATVQPGQAAMISSSGTMTGLVKQWSPGVFIYSMNHSPAAPSPVRRIELYRLPKGARLLAVSPSDLPNKIIDGRIQIFVDVMIPTGGSNAAAIRYRMP